MDTPVTYGGAPMPGRQEPDFKPPVSPTRKCRDRRLEGNAWLRQLLPFDRVA